MLIRLPGKRLIDIDRVQVIEPYASTQTTRIVFANGQEIYIPLPATSVVEVVEKARKEASCQAGSKT